MKNIIAVSSGKGGVGKSVVATALVLALRNKGFKVGLMDLDFTCPSTHIILGIKGLQPSEEKGIIPPEALGLSYMSITFFAMDEPVPLRGADASNAIVELMAITSWDELDFLVIDMPPGLGDATLDMIRLAKGIRFLVVTTPSMVAFETVRKLLVLLRDLRVPVIGVVENMVLDTSSRIKDKVESLGAAYIGEVRYDPDLEAAIGDVERFSRTRFFEALEKIALEIVRSS